MIVKSLFRVLGTAMAVALLAGISTSARAYLYNASADFAVVNVGGTDYLQVTLTNTSTEAVTVPAEILHAVFFDSTVALTPFSAMVGSTSAVYQNGVLAAAALQGPNVGGEFAYAYSLGGLAGAPGGATSGISSSGYGIFGAGNFNGSSLNPPVAVDGGDYGILPAGDTGSSGNAGVKDVPLISNQVVFLLTGNFAGFDPSEGITNVWFQYGTTLSDESFPKVPEPAFYQMAGFLSLGGLGLLKLRRRRK